MQELYHNVLNNIEKYQSTAPEIAEKYATLMLKHIHFYQ